MLFTVGYNLRKLNLQMVEGFFGKKHRLFFYCVMLCRSLLVLLCFFFWPLYW